MDASGFPNDDHGHSNDPKQCSVRGCAQLLPDGTNNKMCDVCRSRHRIYASTKRARRKLEKAAVANAAAARNGGDTFMLIHESDHTVSQGSSTVTSWLSPSAQSLQQDLSPLSSQHSPSTTASWNQAIDPRLFSSSNGIVTSSPFPAQTTSTSSELANALILPTPRAKAQSEILQQPPDQTTTVVAIEESLKPSDKQQSEPPNEGLESSSGGSTRFCSVKGCKAVIPESYEFKMCPPCRTRYRTYGNTKRAKWKMEREAFDREMASLRAIEDEKRQAKGLGPLADSPEELRAWELSIIDEQIELPTEVQPPTSALQPPETDDASANLARLITSATTFPTDLQSPMVMAGVYPASIGSIDTTHSISPYSHLHNTIVGAPAAPLPARMCTVSHCHKILPGYYRYKRCEQHRLQNRHHSQLKRVREKVVKSIGPEDGATALEIDENGPNTPNNTERAKKLKLLQQSKTKKKERKPGRDKGMKIKDGVSEPQEPMAEGSSQAPEHGPDAADAQGSPKPDAEETLKEKEQIPKGRPKVYSCTKEGCYNLLVPAQRWRTCDECRMIERKRQVQVRADQKAAESVYWKSISEQMSAERKASIAADGGGPGSANTHVQGADDASGMDVDPDVDADADGDSEHYGGEEFVYPLHGASIALGANPAQVPPPPPPPPPPTTSTAMLYGPTTSSGNGFSKFFVQLPPAPPPVRKATSEELLKLSDTLTARVYRPKTTPSAIGRILAHNPNVSVDDFSDILEVDQSKPPDSATPANANEAQTSNLASTELSDKSLPTATIPTSAPFVYEAPAKRSEKVAVDEPTASSSKSKRKHKSSSQTVQNAAAGPSTMSVPPIIGPANPYPPIPYGYPPSYPYYPYYMPPYAYPPPPPPVGSDPTKQPYLPPAIISSTSPPPASYFPYPYPPAPYGYTHAYPYLPPRYTASSYGQTSGQQPYPGPISTSAPGYSYYPPPLPPPAPVSAPAPAPAPTPAPPPPKPKPKEAEEPKAPTTFSFHHYKLGQSGGPQEPRKRLKVDPNYLEKFKAHTSVLKMSLMPYVDQSTGPPTSSTVPIASGENTALSESTQCDASRSDPAALQSVQQNLPAPTTALTMESGAEASTSVAPAMRPCATKTCSRSIPVETHATICEKCKLRFKKHQAKAKVKYKLEPRKFLKVKTSAEGSTQSEP